MTIMMFGEEIQLTKKENIVETCQMNITTVKLKDYFKFFSHIVYVFFVLQYNFSKKYKKNRIRKFVENIYAMRRNRYFEPARPSGG